MAAKRRGALATLPSTKFDQIYVLSNSALQGGDRPWPFSRLHCTAGCRQGTSPLTPLPVLSLTETKVKAGEMGKPLENGFEQDEFLRRGEE